MLEKVNSPIVYHVVIEFAESSGSLDTGKHNGANELYH